MSDGEDPSFLAEMVSEDTAHRRFLQYALVGFVGLGINEGLLYLVTGVAGLSYVLGGFVGRVVSILANYAINDRWTWRGRGDSGRLRWLVRGGKYVLTRIVGIAIGLAALIVFVEVFAIHYLVANVLAIGVGALWGFGISERWVWADDSTESLGAWARRRAEWMRRRSLSGRSNSRPDGGSRSGGDDPPGAVSERPGTVGEPSGVIRERSRAIREGFGTLARHVWKRAAEGTRPIRERTGAVIHSVRERTGVATRPVRRRVAETTRPIRRHRWYRAGRDGLAHASTAAYHRLAAVDRRTWVVVAFAAVLAGWFIWYTFRLYEAYRLTGADFGSYVHMMWTTVNGEGFLQQGKFRINHPSGVYWGSHAALTLLLFLPIYALFPAPETLLVTKALLLAGSIVMLWLLAREWTDRDWVGGLLVASYAFNPYLWSAWAFDFQEQALIPLFVFTAMYMYVKDRYGLFLLFLLLTLFTSEFMVPIVGGFVLGLAIAAYRAGDLDAKWPVIGAAFGCVVLAEIVSGFVIDSFSRYGGLPLRVVAVPFQPYVDGPRTSMVAVAQAALQHPNLAIETLFTDFDEKMIHLFALFLPVGFLSLTDELTVPAVLPFVGFAWVLGHKVAYYVFAAHYPFYFLPFVYVGAIHALDRASFPSVERGSLPSISGEWFGRVLVYVLLLNVFTLMLIGPMNVKPVPQVNEHHEVLDEGVESIPDDASVVAANDVYPHVAERPDAKFMVAPYEINQYQEEFGPITTDYVIFDTKQGRSWANTVMNAFRGRLHSEYGLYKYEDGVWIYGRGFDGQPTTITGDEPVSVFEGGREEYQADDLRVRNGERSGGYIVGTGNRSGIIWYGPYEILPPGEYVAYFRVNVDGPGTVGNVHVKVGENHEVIGSRELQATNGWEVVAIRFSLDRPRAKVELRGHHNGGEGTIRLEHVSINVKDSPESSHNAVLDGQDASTTADASSTRPPSDGIPAAKPSDGRPALQPSDGRLAMDPLPHMGQAAPLPHGDRIAPLPDVDQMTPLPNGDRMTPLPNGDQIAPLPNGGWTSLARPPPIWRLPWRAA